MLAVDGVAVHTAEDAASRLALFGASARVDVQPAPLRRNGTKMGPRGDALWRLELAPLLEAMMKYPQDPHLQQYGMTRLAKMLNLCDRAERTQVRSPYKNPSRSRRHHCRSDPQIHWCRPFSGCTRPTPYKSPSTPLRSVPTWILSATPSHGRQHELLLSRCTSRRRSFKPRRPPSCGPLRRTAGRRGGASLPLERYRRCALSFKSTSPTWM